MVQRLLFLLACFAASFAFAQNELDIEYTRNGYYTIYGHMKPHLGYCDSCVIEEGPYVNDRRHGIWLKYYKNGNVRLQGEYLNNRPNGLYKKYYPNGCLKEEGTWSWKRQKGVFKTYYSNEQLSCSKVFNDDGRQIDMAYFYNEDGCLNKIWEYVHPGNRNIEVRYSRDNCNEPCDTLDVGKDVRFVDTTRRINPPIQYRSYDDHDGNCEYEYEIIMAGDGTHELMNTNGDVILSGSIEDGYFMKGKMYCYAEEKVKIYKYKNGKVVKHYWKKK